MWRVVFVSYTGFQLNIPLDHVVYTVKVCQVPLATAEGKATVYEDFLHSFSVYGDVVPEG